MLVVSVCSVLRSVTCCEVLLMFFEFSAVVFSCSVIMDAYDLLVLLSEFSWFLMLVLRSRTLVLSIWVF